MMNVIKPFRLLRCINYKFLVLPVRFYTSRNILQLSQRGLWKDRFPETNLEFEKTLSEEPQTVYAGFDPTANSLHLGNLLVIVALIHFQRAGHNVISLIGNATALVGDPSGHATERPHLNMEEVDKNTKALTNIIERVFQNHEKYIWPLKSDTDSLKPIKILNNLKWYTNMNVISFLRDIGGHMKMKILIKRPSTQERLTSEKPFSFAEFSYQVLQSCDWLHLYKNHDCTIQVGGSDQMGNINCGHELISQVEDKQVTGLTVPLLTTKSGEKYGKSAGNALWLDPIKLSPFDFYQHFVRIEDADVEELLKFYTFMPLNDIESLMKAHKETPDMRKAQKKLAEHITLLVHGEAGLKMAKQATNLLYGGNIEVLAEILPEDMLTIFKGVPITYLIYDQEMTIFDLAMKANCFKNDKMAIEFIEQGAFYVNQAKVNQPQLMLIQGAHILPNGFTLLRFGKKKFFLVQWK